MLGEARDKARVREGGGRERKRETRVRLAEDTRRDEFFGFSLT